MTRTVLLTIGRLPKALDIARAFHAAGWRVIVADPFKRHLTGVSNSVARSVTVTAPAENREACLRDLLDVIAAEKVDLVVPISEETMYVAGLHGRLPEGVTLYSMPQSTLIRLHDKQRFIETCAAHGLAAPETAALGSPEAEEISVSDHFVVKPVHSCSGRGVEFFTQGDDVPERPDNERWIVQRKVPGDLYSTFSIVHGGQMVTTVIYRAAVMSGTVAVCFERVDGPPVISAWVENFARGEAYSGFLSFDLIVAPTGTVFGIECNPRVTSGVHFVEPADLAQAISDPDPARPPRVRENRLMQQFFPCLTETQNSILRPADFRRNLKHLLSARDTAWDRRDPLPFVLMPYTASQIIRRALAKRQSFGEASTFDIVWRED